MKNRALSVFTYHPVFDVPPLFVPDPLKSRGCEVSFLDFDIPIRQTFRRVMRLPCGKNEQEQRPAQPVSRHGLAQ
jgi:hypothetical protein